MSQTRGSITIGGVNYVLSLQQETVLITAGVINANVPTAGSSNNTVGAIKGRIKNITLSGQYANTQSNVEVFLKNMENWLNKNASLQDVAQYYPLFHKDNTAGAASVNQQAAYYDVVALDFQYTYDQREPTRITFKLNLVEGTHTGFISAILGG